MFATRTPFKTDPGRDATLWDWVLATTPETTIKIAENKIAAHAAHEALGSRVLMSSACPLLSTALLLLPMLDVNVLRQRRTHLFRRDGVQSVPAQPHLATQCHLVHSRLLARVARSRRLRVESVHLLRQHVERPGRHDLRGGGARLRCARRLERVEPRAFVAQELWRRLRGPRFLRSARAVRGRLERQLSPQQPLL